MVVPNNYKRLESCSKEELIEMCIKEDKKNIRIERKCLELEEENKKLKEKLSEVTMVSDDEKQSIEHILELEQENRRLLEKNKIYSNALVQEKEENRKLSEGKIIYASEKEQRHYVDILEENKKLREELEHIHGFDSFLIAHGFKLEDLYKTLEK